MGEGGRNFLRNGENADGRRMLRTFSPQNPEGTGTNICLGRRGRQRMARLSLKNARDGRS